MSVYDPKARQERINFAIRVILRGNATTRQFDACFEMGDGDEVSAAIYRRALKNHKLMAALPKYLNMNSILSCYERTVA